MIYDSQFHVTAERLRALIASGALDDAAQDRAAALLKRLEAAVRIVFVGPAAAGRVRAINALVGMGALPDLCDFTTLEVVHGAAERARAKRADGSVVEIAAPERAARDPETMLLTLEHRAPVLKQMRFLSLVTERMEDDMSRALAWAGKRADVLVWWSDRFTQRERTVWQAAPAALKNHAFLVLLGAQTEEERLEVFGSEAAADFVQVVAPSMGGGLPSGAFFHLARTLARHVELARQADEDQAFLLLRDHETVAAAPRIVPMPEPGGMPDSHGGTDGASGTAAPRARSAALREVDAGPRSLPGSGADPVRATHAAGAHTWQAPVAPPPVTSSPVAPPPVAPSPAAPSSAAPAGPAQATAPSPAGTSARGTSSPVARRPAGAGGATRASASAQAPAPAPQALAPEDAALYARAAAHLRERGRELLDRVRAEPGGRPGRLVGHCLETVRHLIDIADGAEGRASAALSNRLMEFEETLVLLEIEEDQAPQPDAVSLLLQLRRDLEAPAAA